MGGWLTGMVHGPIVVCKVGYGRTIGYCVVIAGRQEWLCSGSGKGVLTGMVL